MEGVSHDEAIRELSRHLAPFESSPDGVDVWLDEEHWTCNGRLASFGEHTIAYHFVRAVG